MEVRMSEDWFVDEKKKIGYSSRLTEGTQKKKSISNTYIIVMMGMCLPPQWAHFYPTLGDYMICWEMYGNG
jgi:hypothetical protein